MDPQQVPEPSSRSRSLSSHFPQMPTSMHPYADGIHSLFGSAMQNSDILNQSTSRNRSIEDPESLDHLRNNEREQLLDQRQIREGFQQLRNTFDNSREGQTLLNIIKNVLPFLTLFAAKLMFDHLNDIFQFALLFVTFLQADFLVQKVMSGGFSNKFLQILYCFGFSIMTVLYLRNYSMDDFEFSNTFGLNILYFVSGEFKELSVSSTIYGVIMTDTSFKLITVIPKSLIVIIPEAYTSQSYKRKVLQSIEYCSQLYRCALPFGPWLRHFLFVNPGAGFMIYFFSIVYFSLKVGEMYRYSLFVKKSVRCLLTDSSVGTSVKLVDLDDKQCTVCHEDLSYPIKLECSHVFCKTCIETWLDQKTTCPMCRAEVTKDVDNEWKNGGTSYAIRMF
ncbi:hypothetical protein CRE_17218 [Caenorhabditis remanei]|uniref:RING-type domain-containing protein n=1 Tax=Caenorhabditis remanei TaxID=31234 RepID=E3MA52_CAERE|nr:hypothetical protein CRE_17218 [Caenorhabditis remanei]